MKEYQDRIRVDLNDLLKMEGLTKRFSLRSSKNKVKRVLGGMHASKLRGRGMDFEEVRNYVPGDDIRNIDWKVTARTKKTHSKVFSEEKEKPVMIVVDQSASMFFGSKNYTKSVIAAQLAASIAFKVLKEGDRVGGLVFGSGDIDLVSPKRDRRNLLRFLEQISKHNQELINRNSMDFESQFNRAFSKIINVVTHDFSVYIISDFYRYSNAMFKAVKQLSLHNDVVLIQVTDPMEKTLPNERFVIGDNSLQLELDARDLKFRKAVELDYSEKQHRFQEELKKFRIPLLHFDTSKSVEDQL